MGCSPHREKRSRSLSGTVSPVSLHPGLLPKGEDVLPSVRGQAQRDTALASAAARASPVKAPSPLRSAGALHNRPGLARFRGAVRERRSGRSFPEG